MNQRSNRMGAAVNGHGAHRRRTQVAVFRRIPVFVLATKCAMVCTALMGLTISGAVAFTANEGSVRLLLPQSTAFAILGHSCGGIQEQAYATGFDPASGYPIGDVYTSTRCGGSGRGGGYKATTYSAWVSVKWDFAGNVLASAKLASAPTVNPTFSTIDAYGDEVYNSGAAAYLAVRIPAAPIDVAAAQSSDEFMVSWALNGVNPIAVISSTLTATPVNSTASVLTATVSGSVTSGLILGVQPETTYEITVINTTLGGSSPASIPVTVTTGPASTPPSAPTGITARWTAVGGTTATLAASWNAAAPGDSPVDRYEVRITGSDGGGTLTQDVSGTTLTATFIVDDIPDWSVNMRAHNAAGWGPWSASYTLGGL